VDDAEFLIWLGNDKVGKAPAYFAELNSFVNAWMGLLFAEFKVNFSNLGLPRKLLHSSWLV
jgi:hypothetical protein